MPGPSAWMVRRKCCRARSDSCSGVSEWNSLRYWKGPKKCTWPVAYSLGMRRQSPVATIADPVLPW